MAQYRPTLAEEVRLIHKPATQAPNLNGRLKQGAFQHCKPQHSSLSYTFIGTSRINLTLEPKIKIAFSGWHVGMKSLRFAQLLHDVAGLRLQEAWSIKTKVLNEEPAVLELPASIGATVLEQAKALGVICAEDTFWSCSEKG